MTESRLDLGELVASFDGRLRLELAGATACPQNQGAVSLSAQAVCQRPLDQATAKGITIQNTDLTGVSFAGADLTNSVFASNTLGQEREIVQQVQEGLVDFMVSGSAIWGSVAPRLQLLDFPFLWRDWDHVHHMVDGPLGSEVADYLAAAVRMRPLAWGDSFGFRQVVTRSREIREPRDFAGLKIRTIQSAIYVKAIELMGASPTPMAFGEVYTSLQTGVIDGYEHDANTTVQQRFYEVARFMARTGHIAGVLGLWASTASLAALPADIRTALEGAAIEAANAQRAMGPREDSTAMTELATHGMTVRDVDRSAFAPSAERLWSREATALGVTPWLEAIRA